MFVTIWMCTQEWSLICSRRTAFTFATCHSAFRCSSALARDEHLAERAVAAHRHPDPHRRDGLGRRHAGAALGLQRDALLASCPAALDVDGVEVLGHAGDVTPLPRPSRRTARSSARARPAARSCVPCSSTRPCSSTTIRSARRIVDSRWATTKAVRPASRRLEGLLDDALGGDVDARGGLVEDQQSRVREQRPGERHELALADREHRAALGDRGVVALGQALDEAVGADRRGGGLARRRGGVRPAEGDVVADRAGEEEALLRARCRAGRGARPSVTSRRSCPSMRMAPRARVVEAGQELDQGRLARAGVSHEGHRLARARRAGRRRGGPRRPSP